MKSESSHKLSITKWRKLPLGKLVSYISKGIVPKYTEAKRTSNVVLVLNQRCNRDAKINFQNARWHELNAKRVPAEKYIQRGDILINSTGTGTAGRIAQVNNISSPVTFDGHMILLRAAPNINPFFLGYAIKMFQPIVEQLAEGSTGQTEINRERLLNEIEINFPEDMSIQRKIAAILSALDDKIENNNAICKNLEEQAAALYKSWFVDFEPFGGKKPQSWKEASLKDLVEIKYGKDHKKLNDGMVPVYGSGGEMRRVETAIYSDESVLIPRKGSLNNVIYASDPFWTVDTMFYTRMRINNVCKYVHQFIKRINLEGLNAGSAVPSMTTEILYSLKVHLPTYDVLDHFEALVKPMYEMRHCTMQQNITLASLRDALLPKLLSGEVEVDKVAI